MSPSTLEFHIENLTKQSDDYIIKKVLFCCLPTFPLYPTWHPVVCLICLFCLPSQTVTLKALDEESMYWHSCLKEEVNWWFNCSATALSTEERREGALCTVSPSSGSLRRGQVICLEVRVRPNALKKGEKRWNHIDFIWKLNLSVPKILLWAIT